MLQSSGSGQDPTSLMRIGTIPKRARKSEEQHLTMIISIRDAVDSILYTFDLLLTDKPGKLVDERRQAKETVKQNLKKILRIVERSLHQTAVTRT